MKISPKEGNDSSKIKKKHLFMLENIFSGPKLYPPLYFPGFQEKQKNSYVQFFETSHLENNCSNPLVNWFC